jgi:pimeloyl-ACP methyl ester carboxylesterase
MSAIVVEGELVHYEVLGRGRPVILLHGMIGSWRYWVPLLQRLQQSYRLYAMDLFGFGDSARNPAHFSVEQQAAMVQAFMQELGLPKAAFIGHGLGALVAVEFARSHPDKVARLLMVSAPFFDPGGLEKRVPAVRLPITLPPTPPPASAPVTPAPASSAGAAMRAALAEASRARKPGAADEPRSVAVVASAPAVVTEAPAPVPVEPASGSSPRTSPLSPLVGQPLETLLGRCYRRSDDAYAKLMVDVAKTDARAPSALAAAYDPAVLLDTLRLLPLPLVAVHGDDDPIFPPPPEDIWNYLTADSDRVFLPILLPGVRHFPMLEDERFYRVAGDFLEMSDLGKIEIRERWRRRTR